METMTNEERKKFEDLETRTFALEYERAEGEEDERRVSFSLRPKSLYYVLSGGKF